LEILRGLAIPVPPLNLQEEFAPYRGRCAAGVVARAVHCHRRECRSVEGLFESVLALSFVEGLSEAFGQ